MSQQILRLGSEFHLHNQCLLVQVALGVRLTQLLCFGIGRSNAVSKANTDTSIQHCGCWGLMDPVPPLHSSSAHLVSNPTSLMSVLPAGCWVPHHPPGILQEQKQWFLLEPPPVGQQPAAHHHLTAQHVS